jgi:transcriptional regulator
VYIPPSFAIEDVERVAQFVEDVGAADIVTFDGERPISSLVPIIWDRTADGPGRLLAHVSIANDQWRTTHTDVPALAIVHGPQAYVSPSWYPSKREHGRAVPTWNYVSVHFTGPVVFHPDPEWLRDIVTRLTDKHEAGRADRWHVTDAPESYIAGQLRGIVGVELLIERVEAKAKLSQNRSEADQTGAIEGLRGEPAPSSVDVADLMEHRLPFS